MGLTMSLALSALATPRGAKSEKCQQGGGPRTQMGQGQPLVYILGHAFKIVTLHLAPFNRDDDNFILKIARSISYKHVLLLQVASKLMQVSIIRK